MQSHVISVTNFLPDFDIDLARPFGASFGALGLCRFREAARFIGALPYGRNTDRADYDLVLRERRGTCSTKHALLAAVAAECAAPVHLVLDAGHVWAAREACIAALSLQATRPPVA